MADVVRTCRICRCTDSDACLEACGWVEADLCSTCADLGEHLSLYMLISGPSVDRDRPQRTSAAGAEKVAANIGRLVEELRAELAAGLPAAEEPLIILPG